MADLIVLAERCEQAAGPDREIDQDIFCELGLAPFVEGAFDAYRAPSYTASIDAAMTLVPEGHAYRLEGWTAFTARVFVPEQVYKSAHSKRSMPLALAAAALRARAAITPSTPLTAQHERTGDA